jgi:YHS domain-containing protein
VVEEGETMKQPFGKLMFTAAVGVALAGSAGAVASSEAPAPVPYPLDYCVVTGAKLGEMGKPVVMQYEGREIQFCCNGCVSKFKADPQAYLKKIDESVAADQRPIYPLETCVVDGKPFGSAPLEFLYRNRLVRVDREACHKAFLADPAKTLAALDSAVIARQRPSYPIDTCLVSGQKLGEMGNPVEYVYLGHLVRFCCAGCVGTFEKSPAEYVQKLAAASEIHNAPSARPTKE